MVEKKLVSIKYYVLKFEADRSKNDEMRASGKCALLKWLPSSPVEIKFEAKGTEDVFELLNSVNVNLKIV